MRTFKTLKDVKYYDIFKEIVLSVDKDTEIGTVVAANIIIPSNESSIEEDYANGLLSSDEYIDVLIAKGFIVEVV
jgi:hypothetical protein